MISAEAGTDWQQQMRREILYLYRQISRFP